MLYDFPEFSALQRFYLRAHGLAAAAEPRLVTGPTGIVTLSTLEALDELLRARGPGRAALVALWSLSETPEVLRNAVMARVADFDAFLFGYQPRFGEMDNTAWFAALRARPGIDWHDVPIASHESGRHLFGTRRRETAKDPGSRRL